MKRVSAPTFRRLMNLWPPFLCSGIRVRHLADDYRAATVTARLSWLNRNYMGTVFGGTLFAMTDPFYVLLLLHTLGPDYYVWDQASTIEFVAPGRGRLTARFQLDEDAIAAIRAATADGDKHLPRFTVDITGPDDTLVARVHKTVYVRKKRRAR